MSYFFIPDVLQGPESATNNGLARYNGTTGGTIKNSGITVDDTNNLTGASSLSATGNITSAGGIVSGSRLTDGTATIEFGITTTPTLSTGSITNSGAGIALNSKNLTGVGTIGAGAVTSTGTVTGGTLTDGTASLTGGNLTGAGTVTATGTVTGGTLTDGTASLTGGNLTGINNLTADTRITASSLVINTISTDGALVSFANDNIGGITNAYIGTVRSNTIQPQSGSDVSYSSNNITSVGSLGCSSLTATGTITGGTLTDGTASLTGGNLTGVDNLTVVTKTTSPTVETDSITSSGTDIAFNSKNLAGVGNAFISSLRTNQIQPASGDNVSLFFNNLTDVITISGTTANMTTVETNALDTKTGSNIACNSRNFTGVGTIGCTDLTASGSATVTGDITGGGDLILAQDVADSGPKLFLNNNYHANGSTDETNEIVSQFYRKNTEASFGGGRIVFSKQDDYDSLNFCTAWIDFYPINAGTEKRALSVRSGSTVVYDTFSVYTSATQNLEIKPSSTTSTEITSTGTLYLESASDVASLTVSNRSTASSANVYIASGGQFKRVSSSIKYKKDVRDYDKGLSTLNKLQPKYYRPKEGVDGGDVDFAGLIAEDLYDEGLEEFLSFNGDGREKANVEGIGYDRMVALTINAVKELSAKCDAQAAKIGELEARIGELEGNSP